MKFRTELQLKKTDITISYSNQLLLLGSCFSENIGHKFHQLKYSTTINPLGIVYHPLPLHNSIVDAIKGVVINKSNLSKNIDGLFTAWNIHSRLSTVNVEETISQMNSNISHLKNSITQADYLILTYGTSYYYSHKQFGPVANCHKFPSTHFDKKLSTPSQLVSSFDEMFALVKELNPSIKILLTVSPVRHIKDGIIENNRSKAHLLTAVHEICDKYMHCHYLPSYELLIDDLRDYRYYADDMVHPSPKAIDYIWSKINPTILDLSETQMRSDILKLVNAAGHRPFNVDSGQHQSFLAKQLERVEQILTFYPNLDFSKELKVFRN